DYFPMSHNLLVGALKQAERSEPTVRIAALLRIARVQTALDPGQARNTFETALAESYKLHGRGRDRQFLLQEARLIAAAVAPDLLNSIPSSSGVLPRSEDRIVNIMLDHGHVEAAFEYVTGHNEPSTFPFSLASVLLQRLEDQD